MSAHASSGAQAAGNPRIWTQDAIRNLLRQSHKACEKAILALYALQTEEEKASGTTRNLNGRGFNAWDADSFSALARNLRAQGSLSPADIAWARPRLMKYARQLEGIANQKSMQQICEQTGLDLDRVAPSGVSFRSPQFPKQMGVIR